MIKLIFTFLLRCEIRNAHQPLRADVRYFHIVMALPFLMCLSPITSVAQDKDFEVQQRLLAAKGDSCVQAYDYFHALQYYKQLDSTFVNNNLPVTRNLADIYRRTGNNNAWWHTLICVYSLTPDSMTYNDMRSLYFASKSVGVEDLTIMIGNKILKSNPYDSEIVVSMASYFNDTEHPDKAMALCYDYMQRDSTNLAVMRQYGYAAHLLGKAKEALETYKKLETKGFDNYESALIIGVSLIRLDSTWESRPYLRKAVERSKPKEYSSLLHLGNVQIACGEYNEGIENLRKVVNVILPDNDLMYSIYHDIGEAYYRKQDYKNAVEAFLECTDYKTDKPLLYYNIAQMYGALKESKKEGLFYKQFLDKSHHLQDTEENKELIKQAEKRLEELRKELKK